MLIDNKLLKDFAHLVETGTVNSFEGPLKVGVDLGTANIVLAVVDSENRPVAGMTTASKSRSRRYRRRLCRCCPSRTAHEGES